MAETGMTLNVSPELVRPVIEQKIQAAIVEELCKNGQDWMLADIVGRVLNQQVDSEGKASSYSRQGDVTFISWLCKKAIRECAHKAMVEWIEKNKDKFEKHMVAELNKRSAGMAKVFMEGLQKSIQSQWNFKVDVGFDSPKER